MSSDSPPIVNILFVAALSLLPVPGFVPLTLTHAFLAGIVISNDTFTASPVAGYASVNGLYPAPDPPPVPDCKF